MLFHKKTKWIPLGIFTCSQDEYIVYVRASKKNGMMQFKTKKVNSQTWGFNGRMLPSDLINIKDQWELINKIKNQ